MLQDYTPVLLHVIVAVGFATVAMIANIILGRTGKRNPTKDMVYECGMVPETAGQPRFSVKFYLVAMLFIVFDVETVFLIPWGTAFKRLSCTGAVVDGICSGATSFFGLGEMLVFMAILAVGLTYVWRKGALQWD
jgi:NADH-quinone oxidoreductase subunit A